MNDISRRTLLERSASAAAGMAVSALLPEQLAESAPSPSGSHRPLSRLRVGVIGMGKNDQGSLELHVREPNGERRFDRLRPPGVHSPPHPADT